MTMTACPHCNKCTFLYSETCKYCKKSLKDGKSILPIFGLGGRPLEPFICRACWYVNKPKDIVCKACGAQLPTSKASD